jgi:hypothetical protein
MLTDENLLIERPHLSSYIGGIQRIYRFKSGYGLSVVNSPMLHAYPFAWEAAVLKGVTDDGDFESLDYSTGLTEDVEVFDSDEEANDFIRRAAVELADFQFA